MPRNSLLATGMLLALLATTACSAPTEPHDLSTAGSVGSEVAVGSDPDERPTADVGASQLAAAERAKAAATRKAELEAAKKVEEGPARNAEEEPAATATAEAVQPGKSAEAGKNATATQEPVHSPAAQVPSPAGPTAAPAAPVPSPTEFQEREPEDSETLDPKADEQSHSRDRRDGRRPAHAERYGR